MSAITHPTPVDWLPFALRPLETCSTEFKCPSSQNLWFLGTLQSRERGPCCMAVDHVVCHDRCLRTVASFDVVSLDVYLHRRIVGAEDGPHGQLCGRERLRETCYCQVSRPLREYVLCFVSPARTTGRGGGGGEAMRGTGRYNLRNEGTLGTNGLEYTGFTPPDRL